MPKQIFEKKSNFFEKPESLLTIIEKRVGVLGKIFHA